MKLLLALIAPAAIAVFVLAMRRPKWDDATALQRLRAGTMSDEEKRYRGYYPYHNGPFG